MKLKAIVLYLRNTLTKLHKLPSPDRKTLVPELQHALAVENQEDMVQALRKLTTPSATTEESMPPAKKAKRQSLSKDDSPTDSAMVASSTTVNRPAKSKRGGSDQPEKCKHCGKFVIHTDGICDVYNVPAVHMASTGISDTQSYSVIFQDTSFDDHEYMFMTTLGNTTTSQ